MRPLAFAVVLLLAACGDGSAPPAPKSGPRKAYRFALLPKMLNNAVFNYGRKGAMKTAEEILAKEGVKIEIAWDAPPVSNPAQLASMVQSYADQRVDGISVSVDEANTLRKAIDYAVGKGVPVMTFDSDAPASKRLAFFGTDDVECGAALAEHLGGLIKKGKVAIQSGTTGAPNLQERVRGAKETFAKKFPEIQVVDVFYCNDDVKKAIDDLASVTSAHPDLAGWVLVGGWALFGKDALKPIDPAKTKVVSCDALPEMWPYLEGGKCQMLLAQDLWGWGEQSVRILRDLADGKPSPGVVRGKLEAVTPETLADFKKRWKERFGE
jgi:ribose transport system substrate-binding protein